MKKIENAFEHITCHAAQAEALVCGDARARSYQTARCVPAFFGGPDGRILRWTGGAGGELWCRWKSAGRPATDASRPPCPGLRRQHYTAPFGSGRSAGRSVPRERRPPVTKRTLRELRILRHLRHENLIDVRLLRGEDEGMGRHEGMQGRFQQVSKSSGSATGGKIEISWRRGEGRKGVSCWSHLCGQTSGTL